MPTHVFQPSRNPPRGEIPFREKASMFLDGVTSIFAMGSDKPVAPTPECAEARVRTRLDSYKRYTRKGNASRNTDG